MKMQTLLVFALWSISGCQADTGTSIIAPTTVVVGLTRLTKVEPTATPEEAALIERIVQYMPAAGRAGFRKTLTQGWVIVQLKNPAAQALVDSLRLLRASRAASVAAARVGNASGRAQADELFPATIALVRSLPDPNTKAVVLRRAVAKPADVILVTERTTNHDLRNAISALLMSQRRIGVLSSGDLSIPIRSGPTAAAPNIIDWTALRSAASLDIEGIGAAKTTVVQLRPASR